MHPRLAELIAYLDREYDALRATVDAVPPARRGVRPTPETWSVADVVTHLTMVERRVAVLFETLIARAREQGVPAETSEESVLATFDRTAVEQRDRPIVAPSIVNPLQEQAPFGWDDFAAAHAHMRDAMLAGDGLALGTIAHRHPAFGEVDLYRWIAIGAGHLARHAAQIREIDARVAGGAAGTAELAAG